ncbi:MAG: nucleoside deaminase [Micromonosporaceae bacterium]|nr:nucleoside deaminase [Micromonosporaceae bacterium]
MEFAPAWSALDLPWRECFNLAWESFRAGSVPVGAVLVDATGAVVATGRNLRNEVAPPGRLGGSNLAHAEINTLAGLPSGHYADHILYSTLEPCLLCTAAARYSHIGTLRYAAEDPMWRGIERIPELNVELARRWPRREGPLGGGWQDLSTVLHLLALVERGPAAAPAVAAHRDAVPELLRLAQRLAGEPAVRLRAMALPEAFGALGPQLPGWGSAALSTVDA